MTETTIDWNKVGDLVPAIVQDADTGRVLMLGYMNREALAETRRSGRVTFYSRSRERLWTKGETSGHTLELVHLEPDCDNDALLIQARPHGPTCHLGRTSCFKDSATSLAVLGELDRVVSGRTDASPDASYTARLLARGPEGIARKLGEESMEVILAAVRENEQRLTEESADLIYHLLVLLRARGLGLQDVATELARRRKA